jgi:hypothetical protein
MEFALNPRPLKGSPRLSLQASQLIRIEQLIEKLNDSPVSEAAESGVLHDAQLLP